MSCPSSRGGEVSCQSKAAQTPLTCLRNLRQQLHHLPMVHKLLVLGFDPGSRWSRDNCVVRGACSSERASQCISQEKGKEIHIPGPSSKRSESRWDKTGSLALSFQLETRWLPLFKLVQDTMKQELVGGLICIPYIVAKANPTVIINKQYYAAWLSMHCDQVSD